MRAASGAALRPIPSTPGALPMPPHMPLAGHEAGSFAQGTITKRLPTILATTLADAEALYTRYAGDEAALTQVRAALGAVTQLREGMLADVALPELAAPRGKAAQLCHPALFAMVASTNEALRLWKGVAGAGTWKGLPWLLVECYMYTAIASAIQSQPLLAGSSTGSTYGSRLTPQDLGAWDPFIVQKQSAWAKSAPAAADLATAVEAIQASLLEGGPLGVAAGNPAREGALKLRLFEVVQYCLWGNKTDLSLLTAYSTLPTPLEKLVALDPTRGADKGAFSTDPLIVNEFAPLWEHLLQSAHAQGGLGGRVDIVLDNSGLELYGDLVLAGFLVETGLASQVVFHGKCVPWFVSDVTVTDFTQTVAECQMPHPPSPPGGAGGAQGAAPLPAWDAVARLGRRWAEHVAQGRWRYADHAFWTSPCPFCWMQAIAPELYADLATSTCVITKGDLNYRKLTFDCRWPHATPWRESLQGFTPAPLLSLRTCKADVVPGLKEGQAEALTKVDADWMVNGKFGMIQFTKG